ncbi:MAG: DUF1624 domain-containing protein [Alphaproteobacteria bacterium]|nr:DUF1624 domain-containing protein [Alphaproteobacteria bacterium]
MVAIARPLPATRLDALDALRGGAILAMVVFHLGWDLTAFGLADPALTAAPAWTLFGLAVTVTFLGLVGFNLSLATRRGLRPARFLRRLAVIAASAAAVSLATWLFDPGGFVFFGILHCIALGSVLALPFLRAPAWLVATSAVAILAAPQIARGAVAGAPWHWLGLAAEVPRSGDYVPILPWFGVILAGLLAGRLAARRAGWAPWHWQARHRGARALAAVGRWSLAIYLVHQPILVGLLFLAAPLASADRMPPAAALRAKIIASCVDSGQQAADCGHRADCLVERLLGGTGSTPPARGRDSAMAWDEAEAACATAGRPAR